MMEKYLNNNLEADWQKKLEEASLENLIDIVGNEEDYDPAFVAMAKEKIKVHKDYDEEIVASKIEIVKSLHRERIDRENIKFPAWLQLFLAGLVLGILFMLYSVFSKLINAEPVGWYELSYSIISCLFTGYLFWCLFETKCNAIHLTNWYLVLSILVNLWSFLLVPGMEGRALLGVIISILWLLYFNHSKSIGHIYPPTERKFQKRDYIIIGTAFFICVILPIILFSSH